MNVTAWTDASQGPRLTRLKSSTFAVITMAFALVVGGASVLLTTPAGAAGTSANSISASVAPTAGSVKGYYSVSAKASSGDVVAITLDATSKGCSLSSDKVTFTAEGTCVVDFNDPGNTTFAKAPQLSQSIKVYAANVISVSNAPGAGSAGGSYSPGASATSGDTVVRSLAKTSSGCSLSSDKVTFTGAGTCLVDFNDAGNGAFAPATQISHSVKVYSANTIHPGQAPAAGTVNGTYAPSATATSGDVVTFSLATGSTGCTLNNKVVTFTNNGVCKVDFNDAGNGAFAAAAEAHQAITVGTGNPLVQAAITLATRRATHGHPLVLNSQGGSGTGAVTYAVINGGTAGCWISGGVLHTARAGTCTVAVTKSADATYVKARSLNTTITVSPGRPTATRMSAVVWTGRTVMTSIIGSGFYGLPRIISNVRGTTARAVRDNGHVLTIRVKVASGTPRGFHRFTLIFTGGQRTSVSYRQR